MLKKRTLSIVTVAIASLALTACGGRGQTQGRPDVVQGQGSPTSFPTQPPVTAPGMIFPTRPPAVTPVPETEPSPEPTAEAAPVGEPVMLEAKDGTADSLQQAWDSAFALESGVPFTITTTETEVEALIAARMAEAGTGEAISEMNVTFADGQITLSFTLTLEINDQETQVESQIVFVPSIDAEGNLALEVVSAQAGQLELPEETLTLMSSAMAQGLTGAREQVDAEAELTLTEVIAADGQLTVSGYVTK